MHELEAAMRRFPGQTAIVLRIAARDEAFRDMCEELAAAEAALAGIRDGRSAADAGRREECEGWIDRLIDEMTATLRLAGDPAPDAGRR